MKTKIRNICLLAVSLILIFSCCLALFGCGGEDDDENKNTDDNNDESEGGIIENTDADVWTITFDLNYEGSTAIEVTVTNGEFKMPDDPERDGYMFSGWYSDSACKTSFDSSTLEGNATAYAGWIEKRSGYNYVTFVYNLDGYGTYAVYEASSIDVMSDVVNAVGNGSLDGYLFKGWYTDKECTTSVDSNAAISSDMTVYGSWYKGSKFEAEKTDLTEEGSSTKMRLFQGFSENGNPVTKDAACSGGYYIGDMYLDECYISFEIYSSKAVSDATISLRAALLAGFPANSGTSDVQITANDYGLWVNTDSKQRDYTTMVFTNAANLDAGTRTSFKTYQLTNIDLVEGENIIQFVVSNTYKGSGGTQTSLAPLVDYMMLYVPTDTTLTMTTYDNTSGT